MARRPWDRSRAARVTVRARAAHRPADGPRPAAGLQVVIGVDVLNLGGDIWTGVAYSRPGTIEGARWVNFPNDCYGGLAYFVDGDWGERTEGRVCVP
ncbi:hypothetical protein [Actinomadura kijaniata]|uniref:hypothetical protein n=1 Tax=Actinomadura kijaniata TaxID=46161 RepID=UPI00082AD764|nr:hypothetical protein [Actinomadura kijaniata]